MKRVFCLDNGRKVELEVDGFDIVPVLVGTKDSSGNNTLSNLSKFDGCNIFSKQTNLKRGEEIVEVTTLYTLARAEKPLYNNDIIKNSDSDNMVIEVCLGYKGFKKYLHLEYQDGTSLLEINKTLKYDIVNKLVNSNAHSENVLSLDTVFFDKDGFERIFEINTNNIEKYILSISIIKFKEDNVNKQEDKISKKAKKVFDIITGDISSKISSISNLLLNNKSISK